MKYFLTIFIFVVVVGFCFAHDFPQDHYHEGPLPDNNGNCRLFRAIEQPDGILYVDGGPCMTEPEPDIVPSELICEGITETNLEIVSVSISDNPETLKVVVRNTSQRWTRLGITYPKFVMEDGQVCPQTCWDIQVRRRNQDTMEDEIVSALDFNNQMQWLNIGTTSITYQTDVMTTILLVKYATYLEKYSEIRESLERNQFALVFDYKDYREGDTLLFLYGETIVTQFPKPPMMAVGDAPSKPRTLVTTWASLKSR